MSNETNQVATKIARQLYAMVTKRREPNLLETMRHARYQRTFTDEYLFRRAPRRSEPIPKELQEHWAQMDKLRGK
jgi:hypothetical protein